MLIPEKLQSYFGAERSNRRMNTNIEGVFCGTPTRMRVSLRQTPYNSVSCRFVSTRLGSKPAGNLAHF